MADSIHFASAAVEAHERIAPSDGDANAANGAAPAEAPPAPIDIRRSASADVRKTYYSISEVCSRTGLEPHVLRYWESEFAQLRPKKNRAGNRAYREKDIEIINDIKHLLYVEQYTIPGAKKKLALMRESPEAAQTELPLHATAGQPLPPPAPHQPPPLSPAQSEPRPFAADIDIRGIAAELRDVLRSIQSP